MSKQAGFNFGDRKLNSKFETLVWVNAIFDDLFRIWIHILTAPQKGSGFVMGRFQTEICAENIYHSTSVSLLVSCPGLKLGGCTVAHGD